MATNTMNYPLYPTLATKRYVNSALKITSTSSANYYIAYFPARSTSWQFRLVVSCGSHLDVLYAGIFVVDSTSQLAANTTLTSSMFLHTQHASNTNVSCDTTVTVPANKIVAVPCIGGTVDRRFYFYEVKSETVDEPIQQINLPDGLHDLKPANNAEIDINGVYFCKLWQTAYNAASQYFQGNVPGLTAYYEGLKIAAYFDTANASAAALYVNINGLGAKAIKRYGTTDGSAIPIKSVVYLTYVDGVFEESHYVNSTYYTQELSFTIAYPYVQNLWAYSLCAFNKDNKLCSFTATAGTNSSTNRLPADFKFNIGTPIFYRNGATVSTGSGANISYHFQTGSYYTLDKALPVTDSRYWCNGPAARMLSGKQCDVYMKVDVDLDNWKFMPVQNVNLTTPDHIVFHHPTAGTDQTPITELETDCFYIYLGTRYITSNAYYVSLAVENPMYFYDGTDFIPIERYVDMVHPASFDNAVSGDGSNPKAGEDLSVNDFVFMGTNGKLYKVGTTDENVEVFPDWGMAVCKANITTGNIVPEGKLLQQCKILGLSTTYSSPTELFAFFPGDLYKTHIQGHTSFTGTVDSEVTNSHKTYIYLGMMEGTTLYVDLSNHDFITLDDMTNFGSWDLESIIGINGRKVLGAGGGGITLNGQVYGTSTTDTEIPQSGNWTAQVSDCPSYTATAHSIVAIHFIGRISNYAYLNINNTGAYPIYYKGQHDSSVIEQDSVVVFLFDGSKYIIIAGASDNGYELVTHKVTSLDAAANDTQHRKYASAKCLYDMIGNIETLLSQI